MSEKLRMNAYYFAFTPTNCLPVDKILSAVADENGESCAGQIQQAAINAAEVFAAAEDLAKALEDLSYDVENNQRPHQCSGFNCCICTPASLSAATAAISAWRKARGG